MYSMNFDYSYIINKKNNIGIDIDNELKFTIKSIKNKFEGCKYNEYNMEELETYLKDLDLTLLKIKVYGPDDFLPDSTLINRLRIHHDNYFITHIIYN
jgi:hypothetical protein